MHKIGLIIDNINKGTAQSTWQSFAKTALSKNNNLFIFPGGRLNAQTDSDYLRNRIYSLVNINNLDGLICWSSSIKGTISTEELEQFHAGFDPLPYVTLTHKILDRPLVEFDNRAGMKQLISHSINVHGARKIAFIRAPDSHPYAQARFKGYLDALKEANIPLEQDCPLITDPFGWNDGDAAAAQLLEDRKLVPGKDFDTLVGASDIMILNAMKFFSECGYYVPADYHALGFNNSVESRITECPLSTVNAPFSDLGIESFRTLNKLLINRKNGLDNIPVDDVFLVAEPVIRESCGCSYTRYAPAKSSDLSNPESCEVPVSQERVELLTKLAADFLKLDAKVTKAVLTPLVKTLYKITPKDNSQVLSPGCTGIFFSRLEKALNLFFSAHQDPELLLRLLKNISDSGLVSLSLFKDMEPAILRTIFRVRERFAFNSQYEIEGRNSVMNSLKCELMGTRDRDSLMQSLAQYLPEVGITTVGLALYADEITSIWVGSFFPEPAVRSGNTRASARTSRSISISPVKEHFFPGELLFPDFLKHQFSQGIFIVQPLFLDKSSLGYIVHNVSDHDSILFEELRSVISYALKGIYLFEEAELAKQRMQESDENSRVMRVQKETAQAASEAKSLFLANVSHEIRTPMNAVLGMAELLLSENLNDRQKQYAEDIKTSAMSLLDIVNEILDLSKIQSGKMNLVPIHYDFWALINNISSMVNSLIKEKNISFSTEILGEMPKYLYGDDVRLRQILLNILSNAVKFTEAGYVHLLLDAANDNLRFSIKDTGRGMRKEDVPALFEAFKQFEAEKNRGLKGTGLGLSITKTLVEMMNGYIEVESVYGQGTTVHVVIPKTPGDETKVLRTGTDERVVCPPDTKILVVDDNAINLNVISGLLRLCDLAPVTASSGSEAIEMIRRDRYDVVFMDHMMPEMCGVEATRIIRDMGTKVPIIALTANAVINAKEMLLAAGMDDYLSKPIIRDELNKMLLKWIPSSQLISGHILKSVDGNFESEEQNEFWNKIKNIEGLSIEIGMERVSGQMNLYENTLKLMANGTEKCLNNLNDFLAANNMHDFAIEAHSIKTSLANIGIMELSARAHELEISAGRQDYSSCASAIKPFSDAMQSLSNKLKDAFSEYHQNNEVIISQELASLLARMKDAILRMEYIEINEEIKNLETIELSGNMEHRVEEIKDAVMIMDYDEAAEMIQNLLHDS